MSLFVDTSAFYAVLDRDDAHHERAAEIWTRALEGERHLVSTNYVAVESCALVQHRLGLEALQAFTANVLPVVTLEWIGREDHEAAVEAVLAADRRGLSLVDCTSFRAMRRLGLRRAFAFDRDFEERGFEVE